MTEIDLTPFGFTQTENLVYRALLEGGPSGGYALAKRLNIARANAYQGLNGLVKKHGATETGDRPKKYRAARPDALLAQLIDQEARKLDRLEEQVRSVPAPGESELVTVEGQRALVDIALRTAARAEEKVECVATPELLAALGPVWRRRVADARETVVWGTDELPGDIGIPVHGLIDRRVAADLFGADVFLLLTAELAVVARLSREGPSGYWASDPLMVGLTRAMLQVLTGSS